MDKSALTWPGFILGFEHVTILFIAENVMYCKQQGNA